jgi:hypothetical protein
MTNQVRHFAKGDIDLSERNTSLGRLGDASGSEPKQAAEQ